MKGHVSASLISAWLDRQSDRQEAEQLGLHIETCERCRSLVGEMAAVDEMFRAAETLEPPPRLWTRIEAGLDAAPASRPGERWSHMFLPRTWPLWRPAHALVLAAALVVTVGVLIGRFVAQDRSFDRAMAEIDRTHIALAGLQPERYNPFSAAGALDPALNPFVVNPLDRESNPFQSALKGR